MKEQEQIDKPLHDLIEIIHFTEKVSAKIHGLLDEAEIYRAVKEESAKSNQYTISILLLTDDRSKLRIAESSVSPRLLKAAEKATGLHFKGYTVDLDKSSIYSQVVREGKTVQAKNDVIISELFLSPVAQLISKVLNYKEKSSIITPLERHGRITGALAMSSTELAEYFIPSVKSFAQHISTALEQADEYAERKQMEKALQEGERRYRLLAENATDVIWTMDMNLQLTYVSPYVSRLLGYSVEEVMAMSVKDVLTHPSFKAGIAVFEKDLAIEKMKQKDLSRSRTLELELNCKDGSTVWTEAKMTFLRDAEGNAVGILGVLRDITERRQMEKVLRKSEEKYRNIFENITDVYYRTDLEGNLVLMSPSGVNLFGYETIEEMIGKNLAADFYFHPEDREVFLKHLKKCGKVTNYQIMLKRKDGASLIGETNSHFVYDQTGKPVGVEGMFRDITERKHAEELLRLSEEKYKSLIDNLNVGVYRVSPGEEGQFIDVNQAFVRMLGYDKKEEVLALKVLDIYFDLQDRIKMREKILNQGSLKNEELTLKRKDGTPIIASDTGKAVYGTNGTLLYFDGVLEDITERKRAEEKLRESEEKFRGIAERSFDGIYEMDMEGRITYASPAVERIIGYSPSEIEGNLFQNLVPEPTLVKGFQTHAKVMEGEPIRGLQLEMVRKDGSMASIEINSSPKIKDGKIVGTQGIIRDITERKKTEEELEKHRHHLEELVEERTTALTVANEKLEQQIAERNLVEESLAAEKERLSVTLRSIGDGVITTDMEGVVTSINKAAETITGWTQEEAIGNPLNTVFRIINEKTRKPCKNPVEKVLTQGAVVGLGNDTVLITRDSTEKVIADSGAPIRDRNSKIIGVVLVFRDITEKLKMEQELLRTQKLDSLGNLAGGIAHDFNNILTAVLSNANLARMYTTSNKVAEKLTKIEKASLQAKELTQQLLTFSKGGTPIKKTTSIAELIKDSTSFALRGSNVRCHFYLPNELWPVDVDEGQISQVINNIIINADQAMPEGGIIQVKAENVTIQESVSLQRGNYVKISIKDQGVGIPETHLQKIFDPYFSTKQKGSGLGLSTSYSIIKNHDGYIEVESDVGVGTTFYIWLPASREREDMKEESEKLVKGEGRVLLMDDEDFVRDAASEVLQYLGYAVVTAKDGEEAIALYKKALQENPFDAVIMDLTVPGGMGGKEAISTLIKIDPHVKAIVASGYSTDPVMAHYQEYGFKGVVTKPYSVEDLSKTLYKILEEDA